MTTASAPAASVRTAASISRAVSTGTARTPAGTSSPDVVTRTTSAPRAAATRASAYPCLPDERLPRKRTGSSGSRVPPAVTTTRRPVSAPEARRRSSSRTQTAKRSSGSGRRPGPESRPVSRPVAGGTTCTPRSPSVATLAWVAGCSHISVCMAGAMTTGQRAVSRTLVSRSSAWPVAARASRSAVAGATTTRSASRPIRTCGTSVMPDHTSVWTGLPDRADQVASPTKWRAEAVGTTVTSWPASVSSRRSEQALYAAMPPATPRTTFTSVSPRRASRGWARRSAGPR